MKINTPTLCKYLPHPWGFLTPSTYVTCPYPVQFAYIPICVCRQIGCDSNVYNDESNVYNVYNVCNVYNVNNVKNVYNVYHVYNVYIFSCGKPNNKLSPISPVLPPGVRLIPRGYLSYLIIRGPNVCGLGSQTGWLHWHCLLPGQKNRWVCLRIHYIHYINYLQNIYIMHYMHYIHYMHYMHYIHYTLYTIYIICIICMIYIRCVIYIPADAKPRERFDCLLPGESQSPVIYNIKCSSELFG